MFWHDHVAMLDGTVPIPAQAHFRANIASMGFLRAVMVARVMVDVACAEPAFPKPEQFGLAAWPEDTDHADAACRLRAAELATRSFVTKSGLPSIHKFSCNSGWIVMPSECRAMLAAAAREPDAMDATRLLDRLRRRVGWRTARPRASDYPILWAGWIAFIASSIEHDGFVVY